MLSEGELFTFRVAHVTKSNKDVEQKLSFIEQSTLRIVFAYTDINSCSHITNLYALGTASKVFDFNIAIGVQTSLSCLALCAQKKKKRK